MACRSALWYLLAPAALGAQTTAPAMGGVTMRDSIAVAIAHVTVIDVERGRRLPGHTVLIAGRHIRAVGPDAAVRLPAGVRVVDGRGKYLIPGLWDAHSHTLRPSGADTTLPYRRLEIAMGITATRDAGGRVPLAEIHRLRRRIESGELLAPRIAAAAGPLLEGPLSDVSSPGVRRVDSRERARVLVDSLEAEGADFIKVHAGHTPESVGWVTKAARANGLPVSGHAMPGGIATTISGGIRAVDHGLPPGWCVADSTSAELQRQFQRQFAQRRGPIVTLQRQAAVAAHQDPATCAAALRLLADSGVAIVSTAVQSLAWRSILTRGTDLAPRLRYVTPDDRSRWEHAEGSEEFGTVTPEVVALAERLLAESRLPLTLAAQRAGVLVLAGTDAAPFPYTVPGFALHDELALLVRGGFTPAEALRAATLNPATFLGLQDSLGTIAAGKLADLVLLDADPLADIRDTRRIAAVVANGRMVDRAARQRLLAEQERLAAGRARPPQLDPLVGSLPLRTPRITITPDTALYDEAVRVRVTGLRPGDTAAVHASTRDVLGRRWTSWAAFVADARGEVDLDAQAPTRGSYAVADGMGLFWSLALDSAPAVSGRAPPPFPRTRVEQLLSRPDVQWGADTLARWLGLEGAPTRLELRVAGQPVAAAEVVRRMVRPGTRVTLVRERGLVGVLYEPPGAGARPTVVTLAGTGGGVLGAVSPLLAAHGFTTFALAYYNVPGRPAQLVEMPLEYADTACAWLRTRPGVDAARLGLVGWSKGAELALVLASRHPEIKAVVGMAPSGAVWEASTRDWAQNGRIVDMWPGRSPWSEGGRPLPFLRKARTAASDSGSSYTDYRQYMRPVMADTAALAAAAIPVERSRAAFLFITARDDPTWPATELTELAVARLRRADYVRPYEHVVYDVGGHAVAHDPYAILMLRPETAAETVRNRRDAWARELRFLDEQLARR